MDRLDRCRGIPIKNLLNLTDSIKKQTNGSQNPKSFGNFFLHLTHFLREDTMCHTIFLK